MKIPCFLMLLLLSRLPWAAAQQGTTPGGSGGSTDNSRRDTIPSRPTVPAPEPGNRNPPLSLPPQVFILGKVMREDGSAPPYGAVIELNCGGAVTREAIVGTNGQFNFQFGGENRFGQVFPDASQGIDPIPAELDTGGASSGLPYSLSQKPRRRMIGCDLRAQLAGYRSTLLSITEEPQMGHNDVGTIVLYPRERVQGSLVSVTSLMVPKSAKKLLERAQKAMQKHKPQDAEALYKSAIQDYPRYAEAWFELGALYDKNGRVAEADGAYRESIRADSLYLKPYIRLAQMESDRRNWREAADLIDKALELDSINLAEAYFISAVAHFNLKELDISEKRVRQGQRMDFSNRYPQFFLILANIASARRDSAGCLKELKSYLKFAPNASNAGLIRSRIQQLEKSENTENRATR